MSYFSKLRDFLKKCLSYLDIEVINRLRLVMLGITKIIACIYLLYLLLWHTDISISLLPVLHNIRYVEKWITRVESFGNALLFFPLGLIIIAHFSKGTMLKNITSVIALQCTWLRVTKAIKKVDSFKEFSLLGIMRITDKEPDMYILYFFSFSLVLILSFLIYGIYKVFFK